MDSFRMTKKKRLQLNKYIKLQQYDFKKYFEMTLPVSTMGTMLGTLLRLIMVVFSSILLPD